MNDEWRLEIKIGDASRATELVGMLGEPELAHDLSGDFHDRVIVSRDDDVVFLYAGSREQIDGARTLLDSIAAEKSWGLHPSLKHWHPAAEDWEDPDRAEPADPAAAKAEHDRLMDAERQEAAATGEPEFEVRVDFPSRHEAVAFAKQLREEGLPLVHRWKFVLVGAATEDDANALAERLRSEAPADSEVTVEGTWSEANREMPSNPFAVLGGLGV
jgi:hypothetical protein